ncbi:BglG family transcription antiterminator [Anaerorhabdus sp.]|uniref:BglG family transcription antiterminator n=1 Tax=Anaerorhabdus sp. TaxID=1872524 RepID=UPI002FCB2B54
MLALEKRHILIMKVLINASEPLSSELLGSILGATSRTIRGDIKLIDQILQRMGAQVISKSGIGYTLEVINRGEFNVFLQSFNEKYSDNASIPSYATERIRIILHQLLISESYVKSEVFENQLFISRTTLSADLKKVRDILSSYHLKLEHKPNYGLRIIGDERHIRFALSDYMNMDEEGSTFIKTISVELDASICKNEIVKLLIDNKIHISVSSLEQCIALLQIMDLRIKKNHNVRLSDSQFEEIKSYREYSIVNEWLNKILPGINEHEVANYTLHILSRQILGIEDNYDLTENKTSYFLQDEMLKFLFTYTNQDFSFDSQLRKLLSRELKSMLIRITYGYEFHDTSMVQVKQTNLAFEYAVIMTDYLVKKYGYSMNESEIAVLANHLHFSMEQNIKVQNQFNVGLIWSRGRNESLLIKQKILKSFSQYIDSIKMLEHYELDEQTEQELDLIITDMPRARFRSKISLIQIMNQFNYQEKKELKDFFSKKGVMLHTLLNCLDKSCCIFDVDVQTSEEAICQLSKQMIKNMKITSGFEQMVFQREKISSTERGNNVAIAHSLFPSSEKTIVGIAILKHPITWGQENAQLVFMISNGNNEEQMFTVLQWLQTLVQNYEFVHECLNAKNFEEIRIAIERAFLSIDA